MKEVIVKIKKDGSIVMDAKEFHGPVCKTTLANIAKNIGTKNNEFQAKPEYYETNSETNTVSNWG
jgi:hypothetical protein